MNLPAPPAGPRFADLMDQQAGPAPASPAGSGVPLSPTQQAAQQAIMTNPVHTAKAAADLSKQRLQQFLQQVMKTRNAV